MNTPPIHPCSGMCLLHFSPSILTPDCEVIFMFLFYSMCEQYTFDFLTLLFTHVTFGVYLLFLRIIVIHQILETTTFLCFHGSTLLYVFPCGGSGGPVAEFPDLLFSHSYSSSFRCAAAFSRMFPILSSIKPS